MHTLHRIKAYLNHWLDAVDAHSLHSPFLYELYTQVIKQESLPDPAIEKLRKKLLNDHRMIAVDDLGAGSKHADSHQRLISEIAHHSLTTPAFASLYDRLATYFNARIIVELGTSLGITSLYLAREAERKVYTFEGSPALAEIATISFEFAGSNNITLIEGNIDQTLPYLLTGLPKVDMVFMDANHRYEPTVRYFELLVRRTHEHSLIIIDDIHDQAEMEKAWRTVQRHPLVYTTIDLFRCGLVFVNPALSKQHYAW
ncbi:MAG: class I SAM-dependent methyltransferase [Cyclobacteriaceae bacterium]|nr:class I SAM-dependent methyltransferase [Cyclobacteriaceae bacterium]